MVSIERDFALVFYATPARERTTPLRQRDIYTVKAGVLKPKSLRETGRNCRKPKEWKALESIEVLLPDW